jgi:hypothetical protein
LSFWCFDAETQQNANTPNEMAVFRHHVSK